MGRGHTVAIVRITVGVAVIGQHVNLDRLPRRRRRIVNGDGGAIAGRRRDRHVDRRGGTGRRSVGDRVGKLSGPLYPGRGL